MIYIVAIYTNLFFYSEILYFTNKVLMNMLIPYMTDIGAGKAVYESKSVIPVISVTSIGLIKICRCFINYNGNLGDDM